MTTAIRIRTLTQKESKVMLLILSARVAANMQQSFVH